MPPKGINQLDCKEGQWGNIGTLGDEPEKLARGAHSINQIAQVQGSSPPDRNGSDEQRGNSQPFQPITLRRYT